ncbi:MAG: glycosyl transferase family 1, partial [Bacteroidia bacterium]|nr:glycosyl transferase family 1 [Bacteroidia bacterium]
RFVGTVSENTRELIMSDIPGTSVEFLPYVIHSDAIKYMMRSTVLILIIPSHQSNKSIVTGKLFEYLAAGKPILCLGPFDGDAADIINKCKSGVTVDYYDAENILKFLGNIDQYSVLTDNSAVEEFSRFSLAKRLVTVLNSSEKSH